MNICFHLILEIKDLHLTPRKVRRAIGCGQERVTNTIEYYKKISSNSSAKKKKKKQFEKIPKPQTWLCIKII